MAALAKIDPAEMQAHIAALRASLVPAQREQIVMLLTRLAAHFWNDRGETQWKIVFEDYASDLAEMPLDILAEGIRRYRKAAKFWPKVSELLEHMTPLLAKRKLQLARLDPESAKKYTPAIVPALRRMPDSDAA
jgi:hypothetical protein